MSARYLRNKGLCDRLESMSWKVFEFDLENKGVTGLIFWYQLVRRYDVGAEDLRNGTSFRAFPSTFLPAFLEHSRGAAVGRVSAAI